jgi:glycosyl transferase family 11
MSVVVALQGGLGNSLFQYAYGLALEARGYRVQYDKSRERPGTHREYALGIFGELPFGRPSETLFHEGDFRFDESKLSPPDPCTAIGYWQSEKYFKSIENEVRHKFNSALRPQKTRVTSTEFASTYNEIYRSISIAVHVRRQDYVSLQSFHGLPSVDYYLAAVKQIQCQTLPSKVFVFSDDREWCRENLPQEWRVVDGTNKYDDLRLMSSCKHAVIANSSFSWWGTWLGDNQQGRIVIAPERWFADDVMQEQSTDICPEKWQKL